MKRDQDHSIAFHLALERAADNIHKPELLKVFLDAGDIEMFNAVDVLGEEASLPFNKVKYLEEKEFRNKKRMESFLHLFL